MYWQKLSIKWKITLLILLLGTLVMIYETTKPYPRVVLHELGEPMIQMQQNSTYPFDVEPQEAEVSFSYNAGGRNPFIFEYRHDTLGFTLPPSRFGYFPTYVGHVVEINVTAHLKALTENEALALIHQLSDKFDNLGWQRTVKYNPSDAEILAEFHELPTRDGTWMRVAYWQNGDVELHIRMKRIGLSTFQEKAKPRYGYLVTVFLENKVAAKKYSELVSQAYKRKREERKAKAAK